MLLPKKLILPLTVILFYPSLVSADDVCAAKSISSTKDVSIIALLDVHQSDNRGGCGELNPAAVIELEAMNWVLKKMNKDGQEFVPGVKIGLKAFDTCSNQSYAVSKMTDKLFPCNGASPPVAVIGPTTSGPAAFVAEMLSGTNIVQMGISATASQLGDKPKFPNFFRTVPSDRNKSQAFINIAKSLGWDFVVTIHSNDSYGKAGMKEFKDLAHDSKICIAASHEIPFEPSWKQLELLVRDLNDKVLDAKDDLGVIYFGHPNAIQKVFERIYGKLSDMDNLKKLKWILSDKINKADLQAVTDGLLTVSVANTHIKEFTEHVVDQLRRTTQTVQNPQSNPWIKEYISYILQCSFDNSGASTCQTKTNDDIISNMVLSEYQSSVIDAMYLLAQALKRAQQQCSSQGPCTNILTYIKDTRVDYSSIADNMVPQEYKKYQRVVQFDSSGELLLNENSSTYDILNLRNNGSGSIYHVVGNISSATFALNLDKVVMQKTETSQIPTSYTLPSSLCKLQECYTCIDQFKKDLDYVYIEGDILILALLPVHSESDSDLFGCGEFRQSAYFVVEAFIHAIEIARQNTGLRFGALILDNCHSALRANYLLTKLFNPSNGGMDLGNSIDITQLREKIGTVVGSYASTVTLAMANILTPLKIPQISYASSTTLLDDKNRYPYVLRTVPSDDIQAKAMVNLVLKLNSNYVYMIHTDNDYGRTGAEAFKLHSQSKICVDQTFEIPSNPTDSNTYIIADVAQALATAASESPQIIIFFGEDRNAKSLLNQIKLQHSKLDGSGLKGKFIFIGSEAWSDSSDVIQGYEEFVLGSITFKLENPFSVYGDFKQHMEKKTPFSDHNTPWFNTFWEQEFKCNLRGTFKNKFSQECQQDLQLTDEHLSMQDPWVDHISLAVKTVTRGIRDFCKDKNNCQEKEYTRYPSGVVDSIKRVTVDVYDRQFTPFNKNGSGNVGYKLFNIIKKQDNDRIDVVYEEVGQVRVDGEVNLYTSGPIFYDEFENPKEQFASVCDEKIPQCTRCSSTPPSTGKSTGTPTTEALVYVFAALCALLLVVIAVVIYCTCCRADKICFYNKYAKKPQANGINGRLPVPPTTPLPPTPDENDGTYMVPETVSDFHRDQRCSSCGGQDISPGTNRSFTPLNLTRNSTKTSTWDRRSQSTSMRESEEYLHTPKSERLSEYLPMGSSASLINGGKYSGGSADSDLRRAPAPLPRQNTLSKISTKSSPAAPTTTGDAAYTISRNSSLQDILDPIKTPRSRSAIDNFQDYNSSVSLNSHQISEPEYTYVNNAYHDSPHEYNSYYPTDSGMNTCNIDSVSPIIFENPSTRAQSEETLRGSSSWV